jgi:TnpA family transposase
LNRLRGKELLTPEQRSQLMSIPPDISERDLGIYYLLTSQDKDFIKVRRRDSNKLGVAIQICVLRHLGWSLSNIKQVPERVLSYVAKQIDVDPNVFSLYAQRENTLYDHLVEIRKEYGYSLFSPKVYMQGLRYLLSHALENDDTVYLIRELLSHLKKQKVILPAMTTIERMVWITKLRAEKRIYGVLTQTLTDSQKQKLDALLETDPETKISRLAWLRKDPGKPSPESFKKVLDRLEYLRGLQLEVDVSNIRPRRLRQLARIGTRYEAWAFKRLNNEDQRYGILIAYLINLIQDLTDLAIDINDRVINYFYRKGRKVRDEIQKENGKALNEKVLRFVDLTTILLEAKARGENLDQAIESYISWEQLAQERDEAKDLARPVDFDFLDLLKDRFRYLRQYTPVLLAKLEFKSTEANESLIQAVNVIREMNTTNKRKVPEDAPFDFIPKRFQGHVIDKNGNIDKTYYELATLTKLKDYIRSGDVYVSGSRKYKDLEEYFVTEPEWAIAKETGTQLAVPLSAEEYLADRKRVLTERLHWLSKNIKSLEGVSLENGKIHLDRLEKDTPEEAEHLSKKLYSLLPRIKLTDLLLEVDHWTEFTNHMTHASTGHEPKGNEKNILLAALMAMGTNIGLTKMAEATPEFTYKQLVNASQWRMYDDALQRAQATLVNFQHRLALAFYWGDGTTSSSDGMRVQVGVSSLYADSNPHYGHKKGTTFYRFVSDQLSFFGVEVIPSNAREAVHLFDKVLHHETDLDIKEHYTDTAGYTDQVFGLSHIFGFRFAPRIRNIGEAQLFSMDPPKEFPKITSLLKRISTKVILQNYDHVLRISHSILEGKVSASLVMNKFGSYNRENNVVKALRYMGQIEKTIFLIDYITDETLRRRIQRGLNKGEAMNALARAVFFGKRGELRERSLVDQYQRASALNIILNAITVWNTVYLTEAAKHLEKQELLKEELLNHISPLNWEHINFLGEYSFSNSKPSSLESLRPLNIE